MNDTPIMLRYVGAHVPPPPAPPGWVPASRPKDPNASWIAAFVPERQSGDTPGDKDPRSCHPR